MAAGHAQRDHRESVIARRERLRPVRRDVATGSRTTRVSPSAGSAACAEVDVAAVNRIEGAAEDADAPGAAHACQRSRSRRVRRRRGLASRFEAPAPRQTRFEQLRDAGRRSTAEIRKKGRSSAAARALQPRRPAPHRRRASILLAATICGLAASSGGNSSSSRRTMSRSSTGSRPARARHVDDVDQHLGALEVAEELMAEAEAAMRALDQSGHVGDDEAAIVAQADHAEIRRQRGERVVGDLRPRRRDARDERRLAGVGKADEPDVGEQLQLEAEILLLARFARLHLARRAVGGGREVRVAQAAAAALAPRAPAAPSSARSASRRTAARRTLRPSRRPACRSAPAARGRRRRRPVRFEPCPCSPRSASNSGWNR